ncbi:MAG: hypothetical protein ABII22_00230 [Candidatus Micrarchaeota archaeon]
MDSDDYCPKCKKWNLFGELNSEGMVKREMEKNGIEGSAAELLQNNRKKFSELYKAYLDERNWIEAGCLIVTKCSACGTKLIHKERENA